MTRFCTFFKKPSSPGMHARTRPFFAGLLLATGILLGAVCLSACRPNERPATVTILDATEYRHIVDQEKPWSIHLVKLERGRYLPHIPLARGQVYQLEHLSAIVASLPESLGQPVLAVNGDFFGLRFGPYQGDMVGLHILNGELVSEPDRSSFWIDQDGTPHIAEVHSRMRVLFANQDSLRFRINRSRRDTGAVVFTPRFGPSTHTEGGVEYILRPAEGQRDWLPLRASTSYRCRVTERQATGDMTIPRDALVLSIGPLASIELPRLGDELVLETSFTEDFSLVPDAIGGHPILLKDGQIMVTEKEATPRHPRTLIGYSPTHLFVAVVDGRQEHLSIGMTYHELAVFMKAQGCSDAMNLDGGGSSTMWYRGRVVNSPSGFGERPIANALVFLQAPD